MSKFALGVIDFENTNSRSISNALDQLDIPHFRSLKLSELNKASGLIIPGVGAFGALVEQLKLDSRREFIIKKHNAGIPILGVCLGMQIMFDSSDESANALGLELISGKIEGIKTTGNLRVPHIGWNSVNQVKENPLFRGIPNNSDFYFCHSFKLSEKNNSVIGKTMHGEDFGSVVNSENLFGAQFHPEKSQIHGLQFLHNFEEIVKKC